MSEWIIGGHPDRAGQAVFPAITHLESSDCFCDCLAVEEEEKLKWRGNSSDIVLSAAPTPLIGGLLG